jgi:hypothetical protein
MSILHDVLPKFFRPIVWFETAEENRSEASLLHWRAGLKSSSGCGASCSVSVPLGQHNVGWRIAGPGNRCNRIARPASLTITFCIRRSRALSCYYARQVPRSHLNRKLECRRSLMSNLRYYVVVACTVVCCCASASAQQKILWQGSVVREQINVYESAATSARVTRTLRHGDADVRSEKLGQGNRNTARKLANRNWVGHAIAFWLYVTGDEFMGAPAWGKKESQ